MKILILGGTGFFGKDIARLFQEAKHDVTLFTRGNLPVDGFSHIKGDRGSLPDLTRAAAQGPWDLVIDNQAYTAEDARNALAAFKKAKRYILTSTVSVYRYISDRFPQPLREETVDYSFKPADEDPGNVHWKYARGKMEAEWIVASQHQVPSTIIRPSLVYGPNDTKNRGFWYISRILKGGPLLLADGGVNTFRISYSVDVARSYLLAATNERAIGQAYFIAQSEVVTLRDFIEESAKALKVPLEKLSIPFDFLGDMGGPLATMTNFVPDISKAQRELGYKPTPFPEFVASSAKWFRDHWKGNEAKLLETRDDELALASKWKKSVAPLFPVKRPS